MAKRFAQLVLIPEDGGRLRQFRIRIWPVYAVAGAAVLVAGTLIGAGSVYLGLLQSRHSSALLRDENTALRSELVVLSAQMAHLDGVVRNHIELANDSRLLAGLSPISEEVAMLGVGGTPEPVGDGDRAGLTGSLGRTVEMFHERLQQISRQLRFQEESFVEVRQVIEVNRDRLEHIPTINPVTGDCYTSSGFGRRRDPFTGEPAFHPGIDFCAAIGTPFRAPADGVVTFAGKNGGLGKTLKIDHGNGYETLYGHCQEITVRVGQQVRRGEIIGKVGNTGRSTGPHLHYEIHQHDRPINPRPYLLETRDYAP